MWIRNLFSLILVMGMLPGLACATQVPQIALVIGNSDYVKGPLANPVNDAKLMATTLDKLGFRVTTLLDGSLEQMQQAIIGFGDQLEQAGKDAVGLVYYAGHGIQRDGKNYLIPVTAKIDRPKDLLVAAFEAEIILDTMRAAGNQLNFLILDACRDDPFPKRGRSGGRGLVRMDAPSGTLIAYSTAPGDVAIDGEGSTNSPYTRALAHNMMQPNLAVERMFRYVRNQVMQATKDEQVPWESSSLTGDDYFFNPDATLPTTVIDPPAQAVSPEPETRNKAQRALTFYLNVLTRPAEGGEFRPLADGDSIASGDLYKLVIRPQANSYLYIFQVDATGHIDRLFPMVEYSGQRLNNVNPVRSGTTYYLPAKNKAFYLDDTRGKETIYVFVSPTPRADIEDLSFALEKSASKADATAQQTAQQSLLTLFKSRSLPLTPAAVENNAPTFTFSQDGVNIEAIASAFKSTCASCVHVLEFQHR